MTVAAGLTGTCAGSIGGVDGGVDLGVDGGVAERAIPALP
jgi:hypothetical protein